MELKENLNVIFEKLERFFQTETVVGKPIVVGEVTLLPIIDVTFGMGAGNGTGKDSKGHDGTGGGAGVGAKISPNSILVVRGQEVSIIGLKDRTSMEKVLEMVPDLINKFVSKKEEKPQD